jgi:hypothetical protein
MRRAEALKSFSSGRKTVLMQFRTVNFFTALSRCLNESRSIMAIDNERLLRNPTIRLAPGKCRFARAVEDIDYLETFISDHETEVLTLSWEGSTAGVNWIAVHQAAFDLPHQTMLFHRHLDDSLTPAPAASPSPPNSKLR